MSLLIYNLINYVMKEPLYIFGPSKLSMQDKGKAQKNYVYQVRVFFVYIILFVDNA